MKFLADLYNETWNIFYLELVGAHDITLIIKGSGLSYPGSDPEQDFLQNPTILLSAMGKYKQE